MSWDGGGGDGGGGGGGTAQLGWREYQLELLGRRRHGFCFDLIALRCHFVLGQYLLARCARAFVIRTAAAASQTPKTYSRFWPVGSFERPARLALAVQPCRLLHPPSTPRRPFLLANLPRPTAPHLRTTLLSSFPRHFRSLSQCSAPIPPLLQPGLAAGGRCMMFAVRYTASDTLLLCC